MGFKDTFFSKKYTLNCRGRLLEFHKPLVMGILNLTPDSFYSQSRVPSVDEALHRAEKMLEEGAHILDLGACSTRPGSAPPTPEEESDRLMPALIEIRKKFPRAFLSVDTWRSSIAERAVTIGGADIINDISGGIPESEIMKVAGSNQVPYVLMHMQGNPEVMQQNPSYEAITSEILSFFGTRIQIAKEAGIHDIILDPGFGFGKNLQHNFQLLRELSDFRMTEYPVMVGLSRKSMVYKPLSCTQEEALNGTTVLNTIALVNGASILRVHDVKPAVEAIQLFMSTYPTLQSD